MRKPKAPSVPAFVDFSRTGRPLRTLENLDALIVHAGFEHRCHSKRGGDATSGWHVTINGQAHGDLWPVALAELSSLCRRYDMVSPTVTERDMIALRWRHTPEDQTNE